MSWAAGDVINTTSRMRRLSESVPPSYTVWKDGTTYRAECNIAGGTDISGASATTVIQTAAAAAAAVKGHVLLKRGTYPATLDLTDLDVALIGEHRTGTILQYAGDVVKFTNTGDKEYGSQSVQNLTIDGVDNSGVGLWYTYSHRNAVSNVNIKNCLKGLYLQGCVGNNISGGHLFGNDYGVYFEGTAAMGSVGNMMYGGEIQDSVINGVYAVSPGAGECADNHFFGTIIESTPAETMVVLESYGAFVPYGFKFIGCYLESHHAAPNLVDMILTNGATVYAFNNVWAYNKFASSNDFTAINIRGSRNQFIGNEIVKAGVGTATIVIDGTSGGTYNTLRDNYRAYPWNGAVTVTNTGSYNTIENNEFYVTYNAALETGTGANQEIDHGLGRTPDLDEISLSPIDDGITALWLSQAPTAEHIYVTCTNLKRFRWECKLTN